MNILGINGSPRKNGASARLLENTLKIAGDVSPTVNVDRIDLVDYDIRHCTGCDACLKEPCPLDGEDDYPAVQEKLLDASAIIIASPTYFSNVPGILKDFIDRSRRMKMDRGKLRDKYFTCLVSSGLRNGGAELVTLMLNNWALSHGMMIVGSVGNYLVENYLPITTLQRDGLKSFRKPGDQDEISDKVSERLGKRLALLTSLAKGNQPP